MNRSKPVAALLLSAAAMLVLGGCQPAPAAPAPTVVVQQPDHHDADRAAADRQAAIDRQAAADRAAQEQRDRDAHRPPPPPQ